MKPQICGQKNTEIFSYDDFWGASKLTNNPGIQINNVDVGEGQLNVPSSSITSFVTIGKESCPHERLDHQTSYELTELGSSKQKLAFHFAKPGCNESLLVQKKITSTHETENAMR